MAVKVATKVTLPIKQLIEALRAKATALYANQDRYGPYSYEEVIYPQARALFKDLYPPNLYPTNEKFLERFTKDFNRQDARLKIVITQQGSEEGEILFNPPAETVTEQAPAAGETPSSMAGGILSLPSGGGSSLSSSAPRIIHNIPKTPPPGHPDYPGKGIAVTTKAEKFAQENPATAKIARQAEPQIAKTPSISTSSQKPTPLNPKAKAEINEILQKSGLGEKTPTIKTAPAPKTTFSQPPVQAKTPTTTRINLSTFRPPASSINAAKNLGSSAGRFFKINSGRIAGGLGEMAKGVGRGILSPAASGAYRVLGKAGIHGISIADNFFRQTGGGGFSGRGFFGKNTGRKFALLALGSFLLFGIVLGSIGGGGTTPGGTTSTVSTEADISSCKFTRAGNSQLVKSSILAGWISSAATQAGIPAQILASVAMHESPNFVANADNNHDGIISNYYCTGGKIFCEKGGRRLRDKPYEDDPCTAEELAGGARNAQAVGLMQIVDVYNPGKNLCSITESLAIAAAKLKNDGITLQPTQEQTNTAVRRYYNGCEYGGSFSYCGEVWKDLQNCQTTSVGVGSPPIVTSGHSCVTGRKFVPYPGYSNVKPEEYTYVCGHSRPIFNAIDVGITPAGGTPVFAVVDGKTEDNTNPNGGTAIWLTGDDSQNYYYAHLQRGSIVTGQVKAGQQIGTIASSNDRTAVNNGVAHVHFSAGTPGNRQSFNDPANIPAGPLLDTWCGNNVCQGKPNTAF